MDFRISSSDAPAAGVLSPLSLATSSSEALAFSSASLAFFSASAVFISSSFLAFSMAAVTTAACSGLRDFKISSKFIVVPPLCLMIFMNAWELAPSLTRSTRS
ncbi:hypothetical protein D3C71_850130 [compost metagenome]